MLLDHIEMWNYMNEIINDINNLVSFEDSSIT